MNIQVSAITIVSLLFIALNAVSREISTPPEFTVSAELSETTLLQGAPLYVYLTITRERDANPEIATVAISSINNNVRASINAPDGQETEKRPEQPWPEVNGLEFSLFRPLAAGESYTKTLIVHRWSTTTLLPGDYTVVVEAPGLNFHLETSRNEWHQLLEKSFRKTFPLRILPPDDEVVRRFDALLAVTTAEDASWRDRYRALDSIIFAQGPTALGAQLDLLAAMEQDIVRFGYGQKEIVTMLWYIVQRGNADTARALAALVRGPVFESCLGGGDHSKRGIWPMLGWAIHELHRTGGPEVQAVTGELVEIVPDVPGLVERTFQHGGIQIGKNY